MNKTRKFGKHNSRYTQKLARRKRSGPVNYSLPVDREGNATLNTQLMRYENGKPITRNFSRLARADEA